MAWSRWLIVVCSLKETAEHTVHFRFNYNWGLIPLQVTPITALTKCKGMEHDGTLTVQTSIKTITVRSVGFRSLIQLRVYCTLKRNAGFGKGLQITYPIPSPQDCSRMPVIRIGHGSTVPRLMIMFVMEMGCTTSKWWGAVSFQQYNPRLGPFGYADLSIRRAVVFNFRGWQMPKTGACPQKP